MDIEARDFIYRLMNVLDKDKADNPNIDVVTKPNLHRGSNSTGDTYMILVMGADGSGVKVQVSQYKAPSNEALR